MENILWLTAFPMLTMRMSGLQSSLPVLDIFAETPTVVAWDRLTAKIGSCRHAQFLSMMIVTLYSSSPRRRMSFSCD